jgi:hypothetical protein
MNYQLLPKLEWHKVAPIWAEYNTLPPVNDPYALLSVALDGERIAGCVAMQALLHLEGVWVNPEYSGKVGFRRLMKPLTEALPKNVDYYALTPRPEISRLCEYVAMEKKDWAVYKGRI